MAPSPGLIAGTLASLGLLIAVFVLVVRRARVLWHKPGSDPER